MTRQYDVPEATDLLATIRLGLIDGRNPKPLTTPEDWLEECKKRLFLLYLAGRRDPVPHGVAFLVIEGRRCLLERCPKKARNHPPGQWFVPGGRIEPGETPEEACLREMREELGVAARDLVPLPLIEATAVGSPEGVFLMRPYIVGDWDGELPRATLDGGTPLEWESLDGMLRSPVPQVRMMAACALRWLDA